MSFYDDVMRAERARLANYGLDESVYIPPKCPVCGSRDWDHVYRDKDREVIGCEMCIKEDYDWDGE